MTSPADLFHQAIEHHRAGRLAEASELYRQVLEVSPDQTNALYLLGLVAHQTGNHMQSVELLTRAIAIAPGQAQFHNVLGLALMSLGREEEAATSLQRALALDPTPEGYNNLGNLRKQRGLFDGAILAYERAVALNPRFADGHYNLGNAYRAKNDLKQAAECFRRAIEAEAAHVHAWAALGQVLNGLGRSAEAIPVLEKALALLPEDAGLHCDLGDALQTLGRLQEALFAYQESLRRDPRVARVWYSAGCAESALKDYAAAAGCFRNALEIHPGWPEARHNLGDVLFQLGLVDDALSEFRQAAAGEHPELPAAMIAVIIPGAPASDHREILEARRAWAERYLPPPRDPARFATAAETPDSPLRIGYLSSFFQRDNWMKPVWGLINHHDRQRFEVHLFSDAAESEIRHGYRRHANDRFHDISGLSNDQAADRIEEAGIDILIDLNGYSAMRRLPLLALRPAPVMVGWFNMFATSGMSCYDYLVGDGVVIPRDEEQFYCEKIVRAPGSYLTFEVDYPVPDVASPPCLTNRAITFGCMAPQYKITSEALGAWSAILGQVPHSKLILRNATLGSPGTPEFVRGMFAKHNIAPERVSLDGPLDHYQFLKTYDEIDIALDTFPYNGGTTTTEAIWQGVPVVTFWGDRWVSRTSASILQAGNLGQFVTQGLEGYVKLAIELAAGLTVCEMLGELRRNMRARLTASPVCDTQGFARNMEALYAAFSKGVKPDIISG